MLRLLAAVGRFVTVVSALLIIASAAIFGWMSIDLFPLGEYFPMYRFSKSDTRLILAVIGAFGGLLVAGTIYGLFAAIYDTHRLTRRIVFILERYEALPRSRHSDNP